ncbi:unnamed protein product [Linum trigynum]|uniref:Gnk2-homologous domain-containing protein n=1 Tax=Linum trigynum TaxID=586398 RepID=A0AAV2EZE1_9ROSI
MSSSSSSPSTAVLVVVTIIMSLIAIHSTSSAAAEEQEISYLCNGVEFPGGSTPRVCVHRLLDNLLGWTDPVPVGEFYESSNCDEDVRAVYGYRWRDDGEDAAACLATAKDVLQNKQRCAGHVGGRAWGVSCYMRFEIYPYHDK